ncbi:hypothetical protein HB364_21770 [Pseudoflavitalea sp. X16]|uniref:hypothetical protein n=1 Tax=Paraflavitalea devenefica TaxID=2716334 RepID=UPI0014201953|nr:hypothetical protein [Paraflavitalea devenefica]NII27726.1 hypothetical protein [Paraflavitalea devenefica]
MRRNIAGIIVMLCCFTATAIAQTDSTGKAVKKGCSCTFSSINQVGLLTGETGSYFLAQTINGIKYKTWFAGVGVGLDFYKVRGVPVFLDVRKDLLNKTATPFIYVDGGINFSWPTDKDKGGEDRWKFNNDLYLDAGLGYKNNLGKGHALLVSVGYSLKMIKQKYAPYEICPLWGACWPTSKEVYKYTFNRLSLKVGWQF